MKILGIDPGLQKTGWGVIQTDGNRLHYLASGLVKTKAALPLFARLAQLDDGLSKAIALWQPDMVAVEETFMNNNASSALKLGQARGVCIVTPARLGLEVSEYAANLVKKSIVGTGHASKEQVGLMIKTLLPKTGLLKEDEADALAVAICHAHHAQSRQRVNQKIKA